MRSAKEHQLCIGYVLCLGSRRHRSRSRSRSRSPRRWLCGVGLGGRIGAGDVSINGVGIAHPRVVLEVVPVSEASTTDGSTTNSKRRKKREPSNPRLTLPVNTEPSKTELTVGERAIKRVIMWCQWMTVVTINGGTHQEEGRNSSHPQPSFMSKSQRQHQWGVFNAHSRACRRM